MPLDRRLREEFARAAFDAEPGIDPGTLGRVVERAGRLRRRRTVTRVAGVAAVAAAAAVVFTGLPDLDLGAQPQPPAITPGPEASHLYQHTPMTQPFVSTVHGYSATYPADWTARGATKASQPDWFRAGKPRTPAITVASEALPAGMTEDAWLTQYLGDATNARYPECFPPPDQWHAVTVDGHAGGIFGGLYQCQFTRAVVVVERRAYVFNAMPDPSAYTPNLFDSGLLQDFLATVRLTPETAQ